MKTTLNAIRKHNPCADGWTKLLTTLGKTQADDEPLSIITILDSNGLDDALWALRAVEGEDRKIRLYAVWCARQVQHLMAEPRSIAALDVAVAERFANGQASQGELTAARDAARAAAGAAEAAARAAEWDAARAAAGAAARAAEWDAARAAAGAAAGAAAWDAARAAAWAAARDAQATELRRICQ